MRRLSHLGLRLLNAVPVILLVAVLTFFLMHLLPGDPAVVIAGQDASPEAVARIRTQLGLDQPLLYQLATWLLNLAHGNFGRSLAMDQSVLSAVREHLPVTLSLTLVSLAITMPVGIAAGTLAAYRRNTWIDQAVMIVALLGVSLPGFWIAILSVILFSVTLGWVPSAGYVPLTQGRRSVAGVADPAGAGAGAVPDRLPGAHDAVRDAGRAGPGLYPSGQSAWGQRVADGAETCVPQYADPGGDRVGKSSSAC